MSIVTMYRDMYRDAIERVVKLRAQLQTQRIKIIILEGQRLSMLAHLDMLVVDLAPSTQVILRKHIQEWKDGYENTELSVGTPASVDRTVQGPALDSRCAPVHTETGPTHTPPF